MNFLGMGTLEVLIVLLVAFIFLGPDRMVDAGRWLGKMAREVRRLSSDLRVSIEESDINPQEQPGPGQDAAGKPSQPGSAAGAAGPREGPVSFRPSASARPPQAGESMPPGQEEP